MKIKFIIFILIISLVGGSLFIYYAQKARSTPLIGNKIILPNPEAYEHFSKSWDPYLKGRYKEVIELCEKTLSIDPKHLDAYRRLGNTYEMIGDPDNALKQYKL